MNKHIFFKLQLILDKKIYWITRQLSEKCLENQAEKMIKTSDKKFKEFEVGTNVVSFNPQCWSSEFITPKSVGCHHYSEDNMYKLDMWISK